MTAEPDRRPADRTAAETRLRDALDAVASDRPTPDAWASIRDRAVDAGATGTALPPLASIGSRVAGHRRWLAAAAVLVLVAGVAVVALAGRDGDDGTVTAGSGDPTGFHVPEGLPDGWTVDAVRLERSATACPCTQRTWTSVDGTVTVDVRTDRNHPSGYRPGAGGGPNDVELGSGTRATIFEAPVSTLTWISDQRWVVVTAAGLDRAELLAAGRVVAADVTSEAPPTSGVALLASWTQAEAEPSRAPTVTVELTTPTGHHLGYTLTRPGTFRFLVGPVVRERTLSDDQPPVIEVARHPQAPPLRFSGDREPPLTYGLWPEVDVTGPLQVGETGDGPTAEEADTLLASLRPASADRWRSFVADATEGDPAAIAPTLAALAGPDGQGPGQSVTTTPTSPTEPGSTPATTTTAAPGTSPPGSEVPTLTEGSATVVLSVRPGRSLAATTTTVPWDPGVGAEPLDVERRVETEPIEVEVRPGDPVSIVVEVVNRTVDTVYLPGCFPGGASWNLFRDDEPVVFGGAYAVDCGEAPQPLAPGGSRRVSQPFVMLTDGTRTDSGTPLSPGRYEAVIGVFFLQEPVRVPVVITS